MIETETVDTETAENGVEVSFSLLDDNLEIIDDLSELYNFPREAILMILSLHEFKKKKKASHFFETHQRNIRYIMRKRNNNGNQDYENSDTREVDSVVKLTLPKEHIKTIDYYRDLTGLNRDEIVTLVLNDRISCIEKDEYYRFIEDLEEIVISIRKKQNQKGC